MGFLKLKFKYLDASSVICNKPCSSNCHIPTAVNNFDIDAVLYLIFSVAV